MEKTAVERRVGTWIRGKWYVERLIGRGGTAAVYAAKHKIGRQVALKVLHKEHVQNAELCERFQREALAANRFDHPAAVEITDVDVTEDGAPYLVMELVSGPTLAARIERGPVPVLELCDLMIELLDVLAAAHARGIIHRDIKPENLVVEPGGRLRVLDFGIAKIEGSLLTARGETVGTAMYMAPEQLRGEPIDVRADIFAVGATMFHAISGRTIHIGANTGEVIFAAAIGGPPSLRNVLPSPDAAPDALTRIVDRALAFDKSDRYADAHAMQSDLRALVASERAKAD